MASSAQKQRSLTYRRARWLGVSSHKKTLQTLVREALDALPNVEDTKVIRPDGQILELRHRIKASSTGSAGHVTMIHIAAYTPRDTASTVPMSSGTPDADLASLPPPRGQEFLDGDLMALLRNDDVCVCTSNTHEAVLQLYLMSLLQLNGVELADLKFELQKVANRKALKKLVANGVKEVTFDFVAYDASIAASGKSGGQWKGLVDAVLGKDKSLDEIVSQAGVQSLLTFKADGRIAHGAGQGALVELANHVLDEEADGFVIHTKSGDKITSSEMSIRRRRPLDKDGKTVKHNHAWAALSDFYEYIVQNNINEF